MSAKRSIEPLAVEAERQIASWIADYAPVSGVPDELMDANHQVRRHWSGFLDAFATLGEADADQRFAGARRRIREMGVSYRVHGENKERIWPLGRIPLLLPEAEWREIAAGVAQRAEVLDLVLRDLYGAGRLVADGILPAAAVAGSPEFIRPMCGVEPPGGRWLRFYAVDLGRGPDGKWRVLSDRAQAPSGAGYVLENQLVLAGAFPGLYRDFKVTRLAPFFRDFRAALASVAQRADPRICLMTPGSFSETHSEQAYLARYLGFLLVEGDDLVTRGGKLYVRTIAGLKRADVVWRRVDADWCDPLELNAASRLGVAGLLDAIRQGSVTMVNMPGAGLVKSRALASFLPTLAQRLLGQDLLLPSVATWWCGQDKERAHVLRGLDKFAIRGAFSESVPGRLSDQSSVLAAEIDPAARARLLRSMEERGVDYVGQETFQLSTMPAWSGEGLKPRPFVLRVFAAATPDGWRVMPGGLCRVAKDPDASGLSMGAGAQSADVWVLSERPIEKTTLLPHADDVRIVRVLGALPSRAADNLFWMGRYLERAEATLRLTRSLCNRLAETGLPDLGGQQPIERLGRLLVNWGCVPATATRLAAARNALASPDETVQTGSALSHIRAAKHAAAVIRERLSQEVWRLIGDVEGRLANSATQVLSEPEALEYAERSLHTLAALSGLIDENFNRVGGWSFLDLGKRTERAINTCRYARQFVDADATAETLDALLELINSQISYRSRYLVGPARAPVLDMTILDPFNPRSVGFQALQIDERLAALPSLRDNGVLEPTRRLAVRLRADLEAEEAHRLDTSKILSIEQQFMSLADAIAARYFAQSSNSSTRQPTMLA